MHTFQHLTVLKASSAFPTSNWPSDPATLARFDYDKIQLLKDNFAEPLECCVIVVLLSFPELFVRFILENSILVSGNGSFTASAFTSKHRRTSADHHCYSSAKC